MSQILASTPAWTIPGFLEARENNHLFISGADATALTYKYGTPLFVFSEARIRRNIARLQSAAKQVERPIKFCYASKANSNMAVLGVVRTTVSTANSFLSQGRCSMGGHAHDDRLRDPSAGHAAGGRL